jgi:hypothetical protein
LTAALAAVVLVPLGAAAKPAGRETVPTLAQSSHDDCASPLSYHASEVEPQTTAHGSTVISTFQVGRVYDGGSCDIGWARTTDGHTWQHGLLPLTVYGGQATTAAGPLTRASDPSVAYDAQDGVWLIDSLGLAGNADVPGVFVNRSTDDGVTWSPPIATHVATSDSPDKNWITCDNWPTSAGYGNCYQEYDDSGAGEQIKMQTSTDGGLTWSPAENLVNGQTGGLGGVPVVQPPAPGAPAGTCGRVVVPIAVLGMAWFTSSDCGATWSAPTQITPNMTADHEVAGDLRTELLPTSSMDGAGAVYVVWQTRSFRTQNTTLAVAAAAGDTCVRLNSITGLAAAQTLRIDPNGGHPEVVTIQTVGSTACNGGSGATFTPALAHAHAAGAFVTKNNVASNSSSDPNDIALSVMPAPTDANPNPSFGSPVRIPIEPDSGGQSNTNDHFIPGIAADPNTSGATAHLGLFYYTYRQANCQALVPANLCIARVGYAWSIDGGASWSKLETFGAMSMAEIPRTNQGPMVGDYAAATVFPAGPCQGRAVESFALGLPPQPNDNAMNAPMYAPACGLPIGVTRQVDVPVQRPPSGRAPARSSVRAYKTAR